MFACKISAVSREQGMKERKIVASFVYHFAPLASLSLPLQGIGVRCSLRSLSIDCYA
jgi:hypothetical protein